MSCKVNNVVEGLHYRLYNSKDLEFVDLHTSSGLRNYTRSLFFVLCKAVHDIYPKSGVVIDIPVSNGYYCNLDLGHPVGLEDVDKIRNRMQEIVNAKMPIRRYVVPTEDAIKMFEEKGDKAKVKLLKSAASCTPHIIRLTTMWITTTVRCSPTPSLSIFSA